jgi:hypothetical protein
MMREQKNLKTGAGRAALLALAALVAAGCQDLGTEPEVRVPASIQVATGPVQLVSLGERATIQATVLDQFGQPVSGVSVSFSAEDPSVITVAPTGEVLARANGETRVQLRVQAPQGQPTPTGYLAGVAEATVPVVVRQQVASIRARGVPTEGGSPLLLWALGQRRPLEAEVRDALGNLLERPVTVGFASELPSLVTVSQAGELRAVADGATRIQMTAEGVTAFQGVEVRSGFNFAACVSTSASRLNERFGGPGTTGTAACADVSLRAIMGEP